MTEETFDQILQHLEDQKHPSNSERTQQEEEILFGLYFFEQMTKELKAMRESRELNNN